MLTFVEQRSQSASSPSSPRPSVPPRVRARRRRRSWWTVGASPRSRAPTARSSPPATSDMSARPPPRSSSSEARARRRTTSVAAPDDGSIAGTVSDGAGGWFVGGSFTSFGGVACPHLVHVLPGGAVDGSWCPHADVVSNLVREGRVIYAVVPTPSIGGPGTQLARFDAQTAAQLPWHVPLGTSRVPMIMPSNVWTLVATPTRVYLGGGFASVDGHKAIRLAAIDARTGRFVWSAKAAGGPVDTLALGGGRLYAEGSFYIVDGEPRDGFAVLERGDRSPELMGATREDRPRRRDGAVAGDGLSRLRPRPVGRARHTHGDRDEHRHRRVGRGRALRTRSRSTAATCSCRSIACSGRSMRRPVPGGAGAS